MTITPHSGIDDRKVDSREAEERLAPLMSVGFRKVALAAGDVSFSEAGGRLVGIENKKVSQLLTDLASGQLMKQCERMAESFDFPILMIEGRWSMVDGYLLGYQPWTWDQIWNYLATIQDLGVRLQITTTAAQTVERIIELWQYYRKGTHVSTHRATSGDHRIDVLTRIDGIGPERAKAILDLFPTLRKVARAGLDLTEVEGVGGTTAEAVINFFGASDV